MPATVLIAPPEHHASLKGRDELTDALTFSDADALRALDAITTQRPEIVALERMFAATSRGAALINRIKADPSLTACEIRIVAHDSEYSRVPTPRGSAAPAEGGTAVVTVAEVLPVPAALDEHGTRRAPRYDIVDGVDILIDGNPAALIDLSIVGAQAKLVTSLKPNQRVRVALPDPGRAIRVTGSVAWAKFEIPKEGPRYRVGVEFFEPDVAAIQRFIETNRKSESPKP